MGRASSKNRERAVYEWEHGTIANIGVTSPHPYGALFDYIKDKNILEIVHLFLDDSTTEATLTDICVLQQFWWSSPYLAAARYSKVEHPDHYVGEYVFDNILDGRTIIEVRQPDLDGAHWRANHIHIVRGKIDPSRRTKVIKPTCSKHVELKKIAMAGVYIMKVEPKYVRS